MVWQQLFLTFVRQYGSIIEEMPKSDLAKVAKKHNHKMITPEILKELSWIASTPSDYSIVIYMHNTSYKIIKLSIE